VGRRNRVEADPPSTFDSKTLRPYTAAVIEPFSKQFMRDLPALYAECRSRLPGALARKFDRTALGFEEVPGDGFESLADTDEIDIETDSYAGLLGALSDVVNSADITAWALSPQGEVALLGVRDDQGQPAVHARRRRGRGVVGQLLGRPVVKTSHVSDSDDDIVGVAGDWASAVWGAVENVRIDVSAEATLIDTDGSPLGLWQRNMIAVRAEIEIGFAPSDPARFVRLKHGGEIAPRTPQAAQVDELDRGRLTGTGPLGRRASPGARAAWDLLSSRGAARRSGPPLSYRRGRVSGSAGRSACFSGGWCDRRVAGCG
jgi:HK97 family phage major capsid protein